MASRTSQSAVECGAKIHKSGELDVRAPSDKDPCHISAVEILPDGRLVVTDFIHSSVKLIDSNHKVIGHLQLPYAPLDMAVVSISQVVVTYSVHRLQLITVTDTLTLGNTIATNGRYNGIVYYQRRFIVTDSENPSTVLVLDMGGRLLSKIRTKHDRIIYCNVDIDPRDRTLYVTDYHNHTVTRITIDGSVLSVYRHEKLINPRGLVVHPNGTVYVCGFGSHNVHHITARCLHIKTLLDKGDVHQPWAVCCNQRGDRLYISEVNNNSIKVFTISA